MIVGIPKEMKSNEYRVAITPSGVVSFVNFGHRVLIETSAGLGSSFTDEDYQAVGAEIVDQAADVWTQAELILKVKEPLESEFQYLREDLTVFTYLHLSAAPALTQELVKKKTTAIAYETVEVNRTLPLLTPMSEVAGRMTAHLGAQLLGKHYNGKGILLSGVPGVQRGKITIIGGGIVGTHAAKVAVGFGAKVSIIDVSIDRLRQLDDIFGNSISTIMSNPYNIAREVTNSDLVIGAVLIPGAKAPTLVPADVVAQMQPGSVIIDVAVDQGGIFETIDRTTTLANPTYMVHDVVHYAVPNIPSSVPQTSTVALTNATMPYALQLANQGIIPAIKNSAPLQAGVNTAKGHITYEAVAKAFDMDWKPVLEVL